MLHAVNQVNQARRGIQSVCAADIPSATWDAMRGYGDPNNVQAVGAADGLIECIFC